MGNYQPTYCPHCGTELTVVERPTYYRCDGCDRYVFYNPTPGGSVAVVDGDRLLLVEDFRSTGRWKLPSGAIEAPESPREGAARELVEETGLTVTPDVLTYFHDSACEPEPGKHLTNVSFAVAREQTSGSLEAGSDATDARFFRPTEFENSTHSFTETHVDRFGTDSLRWLLERAGAALDGAGP